jgi:hypothetical protein
MAKKPVNAIPAGVKVVKRKGKGQKKKKNGPHQHGFIAERDAGKRKVKPMTPERIKFLQEQEAEQARINKQRSDEKAAEAARYQNLDRRRRFGLW